MALVFLIIQVWGFGNPLATQGVGVDHAIDSSPLGDISNALNT